MTVHFTTEAFGDLQELPAADAQRLLAAIATLQALPHSGRFAEMAAGVGANVTAIPGGFRLRKGDWRALLTVSGDTVTVQRVKNRRDAYG